VQPNGGELWGVFSEHLSWLFGAAPGLRVARERNWWAVFTNEPHIDLNQSALLAGASAEDARCLAGLVEEVGIPVVVSVASGTDEEVTGPLASAGLVAAQLPEPLMWLDELPAARECAFEVRRVIDEAELDTACRLCSEAHSMDEQLVRRVLRRELEEPETVSTWIAWDATEPVSVVWLTLGPRIGVWEMMTPPEHRRRGAARAVLTTALRKVWTPRTEGAFLWASPAGRPLYESLGFRAVDEPIIWYTAGHDDAAAAVGQPADG
jgi:hypothetical protein